MPVSRPATPSTSSGSTAASGTAVTGASPHRAASSAVCSAVRAAHHSPVPSGRTRARTAAGRRPCRVNAGTARRRSAAVPRRACAVSTTVTDVGSASGLPSSRRSSAGTAASAAPAPPIAPPSAASARSREGSSWSSQPRSADGQRDEGQRGLDRPGVHDEDVGVGAAQLREQRELGRAGQSRHGRRGRQVEPGQDGGEGVDVRGPEPFHRGLRVHDGHGEPGHRVESGDGGSAARQERRALPRAGGTARQRRRTAWTTRPRPGRSRGVCAPGDQPSTRFLSSLSAVSRMTFSALRFIMPSSGILVSIVIE